MLNRLPSFLSHRGGTAAIMQRSSFKGKAVLIGTRVTSAPETHPRPNAHTEGPLTLRLQVCSGAVQHPPGTHEQPGLPALRNCGTAEVSAPHGRAEGRVTAPISYCRWGKAKRTAEPSQSRCPKHSGVFPPPPPALHPLSPGPCGSAFPPRLPITR